MRAQGPAATARNCTTTSEPAANASKKPAASSCSRASGRHLAVSGEDFLHHLAGDICEPEVAALEAEGEALMIDAQEMKHGGMKVVHVNRVFRNVIANVV